MAKPVATTDYAGIYVGASSNEVVGNLLANDIPAAGDTLYLRQLGGISVNAKHGMNYETTVLGQYGTFFVKPDGSYRYELDKTNTAVLALHDNQSLTEKVSLKISNGNGETDFDYLNLTIHAGTNHKPQAVDDFVSTNGGLTAKGNVIANDIDLDSGTKLMVGRAGGENTATLNPNDYSLHFVATAGTTTVQGVYGTLEIDRSGNYTYHLDTNDADYVGLNGAHAVDNFQYRMYDDAFGTVPNSNSTDVAILHVSINDTIPTATPV